MISYIGLNRGEFLAAGESGLMEKSVYGEKADIKLPGETTKGLSSAMLEQGSECADPPTASELVLRQFIEGQKIAELSLLTMAQASNQKRCGSCRLNAG